MLEHACFVIVLITMELLFIPVLVSDFADF